MILMVLYHDLYYPLHHHYSVNYGDAPQFGDLLALISGAASMILGGMALRARPKNSLANGLALIAAGAPTLVLTLLWAYPVTFHLTEYPEQPFYYGYVYFEEFGQAQIGSGMVQTPLLISSAAVLFAGCLMAFARGRRAVVPTWQ